MEYLGGLGGSSIPYNLVGRIRWMKLLSKMNHCSEVPCAWINVKETITSSKALLEKNLRSPVQWIQFTSSLVASQITFLLMDQFFSIALTWQFYNYIWVNNKKCKTLALPIINSYFISMEYLLLLIWLHFHDFIQRHERASDQISLGKAISAQVAEMLKVSDEDFRSQSHLDQMGITLRNQHSFILTSLMRMSEDVLHWAPLVKVISSLSAPSSETIFFFFFYFCDQHKYYTSSW